MKSTRKIIIIQFNIYKFRSYFQIIIFLTNGTWISNTNIENLLNEKKRFEIISEYYRFYDFNLYNELIFLTNNNLIFYNLKNNLIESIK